MPAAKSSELDSHGRERRSMLGYLQFSLSAVVVITAVIASISVGPETGRSVFAITAALVVVSAGTALVRWERLDRHWPIVVAVFDLVVVAVLRDVLFDYQRGLSALAALPVIWLAYRYSAGIVAGAIAANAVVAVYPYLARGGLPTVPSDWGSVIVVSATTAVVAIAVHAAALGLRRQRVRFMNASHDLRIAVASGLDRDERLRVSLAESVATDSNPATSAALAVMDTVDAAITFYDPNGDVVITNNTARELAGTEVGPELPGTSLPISATPGGADAPSRRAYWVGEGEDQRAMMATSQPVHHASGELIGTVVATHDVTPLAAAIRSRDEFLESLSHELRTPLTSIIGYLEVIDDAIDVGSAGIRSEFEIVQRNSMRLLRLVDDLLITPEDESPLGRRPSDIGLIAAQSLDAIRPAAAYIGVTVRPFVPATVLAEVHADRIGEVIDKLLSNALKFNRPGGEIAIGIDATADEVAIRVTDTGIGMAASDREHMFERFFRGAGAQSGVLSGSGLGLSTAKVIVEAHNGSLVAQSELGLGTTMVLRLPVLAG